MDETFHIASYKLVDGRMSPFTASFLVYIRRTGKSSLQLNANDFKYCLKCQWKSRQDCISFFQYKVGIMVRNPTNEFPKNSKHGHEPLTNSRTLNKIFFIYNVSICNGKHQSVVIIFIINKRKIIFNFLTTIYMMIKKKLLKTSWKLPAASLKINAH